MKLRRSTRVLTAACFLLAACARPEPQPSEFLPDSTLRSELGLTDQAEVHRVSITGGESEIIEPAVVSVPPGAYVEFVTADWRIHEVQFEVDSLDASARTFLQGSDQISSPPMVDQDSRFVVWFEEAPPGRYPFVVRGNGAPTRGVVVVRQNP